MSHFCVFVLIPADFPADEIEERIDDDLAPFYTCREVQQVEEDGEKYWTNPDGHWDWFQIGGRWTGHLSDYDPEKDPANIERCDLCECWKAGGAKIARK